MLPRPTDRPAATTAAAAAAARRGEIRRQLLDACPPPPRRLFTLSLAWQDGEEREKDGTAGRERGREEGDDGRVIERKDDRYLLDPDQIEGPGEVQT